MQTGHPKTHTEPLAAAVKASVGAMFDCAEDVKRNQQVAPAESVGMNLMSRPSDPKAVHHIFAELNCLRNPMFAAIYLSLATSYGTAEELDFARRRVASVTIEEVVTTEAEPSLVIN